MPAEAVIKLGNRATVTTLFAYPNTGHENETLSQTIEHYFNSSMSRENAGTFTVAAQVTDDLCSVSISSDNADAINQIGRRYQSFFDIGQIGLQAAAAFQAAGKWDAQWKFFLPLGTPLAFARAVEVMDFPPVTLIGNQDYLHSKTTSRWWELLMLNGVTDSDKALYSCILDIVPVAAPAADGEKLTQSGIYNGPFDKYGLPLLQLLAPTQDAAARRPLIVLGLPIRSWVQRNWNLALEVGQVGAITLGDGDVCNVIASNHPSLFYYAVNSNTGPDAVPKNIAAGLAVMKQDIVCAAWHAQMGTTPGADPREVLAASQAKWAGKDDQLLALVIKEANEVTPLALAQLPAPQIGGIRRFLPNPNELKKLESRFYAEGARYRM